MSDSSHSKNPKNSLSHLGEIDSRLEQMLESRDLGFHGQAVSESRGYAEMGETEVDAFQSSLRPTAFNDYVGQKRIIENISIAIGAATERSEALDHVLLHGPPGLGKTSLAAVIAAERGVGFKSTSGPVIERPGDLAAILSGLSSYDVLFIDEIHRLNL